MSKFYKSEAEVKAMANKLNESLTEKDEHCSKCGAKSNTLTRIVEGLCYSCRRPGFKPLLEDMVNAAARAKTEAVRQEMLKKQAKQRRYEKQIKKSAAKFESGAWG